MVIPNIIDIILHLDTNLIWLFQNYGLWTYLILFIIIFCETGLVVTPFLPGDSLLFALGALAATGSLDVSLLFVLLSIAAITGNTVNYFIGYSIGKKIIKKRIIKREYLAKTHRFYEKYGGKTVILTRFIPILRTIAPFLAGLGSMKFLRFSLYNITGGIAWIAIFIFGGYYFGNIPVVKANFTLVILAIIVVSLIPVVIEYMKYRKKVSV